MITRICVIFDIDGTLLDSTESDSRLYGQALREVLGELTLRANWHDYEHVTDEGILHAVCEDNGLDLERCRSRVRARFGALVAEHLADEGACAPIRGARGLFEQLRTSHAFQIGIATGGWGHTARLKLSRAGYQTTGVPLRSSDDHHTRCRIMMLCREAMEASGPVVYLGDGEWDRRACEQLGWGFIGVGERLRGRCERWAPDLSIAPEELEHAAY